MATAREYAENICKAAPLAVRAAKEAMARGADTTLEKGFASNWTWNIKCYIRKILLKEPRLSQKKENQIIKETRRNSMVRSSYRQWCQDGNR